MEANTSRDKIIIMHNYGPDAFNGSVHIEVPDTLSADDLDRGEVYREVCEKVQEEFPEYTLQVAMDTDFSASEDAVTE